MSDPTGHVEPYRRKISGEYVTIRNRWRLVVNLHDAHGKRVREVRYFDGGKKGAEASLAEWLVSLRRSGRAVTPVTGAVGEWLDEWLRVYVEPKGRDGELALSTVTGYQGTVRRYLKPAIGEIPLKRLKAEDVTALYNAMGMPKSEGGLGLSPRTRELTHVVLRAALGKAVEIGRVRVNVLERGHGVDRPKVQPREVTALEADDVVTVIESLRTAEGAEVRRLYLPAFLALVTGMRRGEVLALTWDEVTFPKRAGEGGMIAVTRAWDKGSARGLPVERYRIKLPKNGKPRYVDIAPEVVEVLREAKAEHAARKLASGEWITSAITSAGAVVDWGELVISDDNGMPWWPDTFSKAWGDYCRDNEIKCRFHDLRATSGSFALESGIDPETVRQRLGHHNAAFFLTKYAKAMHRAREKDAGIMGGLASRMTETASTGTNGAHR
jgi:integrase